MNELLRSSGIKRRLTTTYTPQQNGTAERKNRTLVEMARCMLIESGLPPCFWAEAISTANHIRNRCITKSLNNGTSYEKWFGKQPDIKYFRKFGSRVMALNKTPNKGKLINWSMCQIFNGNISVRRDNRLPER